MNYLRFIQFFVCLMTISIGNSFLHAQDPIPVRKSENKVAIDGKVYYVHVVKAGQTLYSISRAYGVKEDLIIKENPESIAGLKVGQVLKIPFSIQEAYTSVEVKDTVKYIYHKLSQGETAFALSRTYAVSTDAIADANPGIEISKLPIGQVIKIPRPQVSIDSVEYFTHRVRRRETIYGISRQYNITQEELILHNPVLEESGLKMWQVLKIPVKIIAVPDSQHVVIDSIPSDHYRDSVFHSEFYRIYDEMEEAEHKKVINIAYLIPFDYEIDSLDSTSVIEQEVANGTLPKRSTPRKPENLITLPNSVPFLEFLEGSLIALDSLKRKGVSINVKVFDTKSSPSTLRSIITSGELDQSDLIIGPFHSYNVELIADFSSQKGIPLIVPFYGSDSLLRHHPYLFQMAPSDHAELDAIAWYAVNNPESSYLILSNNTVVERERVAYLKQSIIRKYTRKYPFQYPVIKELVYMHSPPVNLSDSLPKILSPDAKNIVIVPSSSEAFVFVAVNQLFFQLKEFSLEVVGMSQWSVFDNVELDYLHKLNLMFFSPYYTDFGSPEISNFLFKYRGFFSGEPSSTSKKGCRFAYLGYDLTFHFAGAYQEYGNRFLKNTNGHNPGLLMSPFIFNKPLPRSGFENQSFFQVRYKPELSITGEKYDFPRGVETGALKEVNPVSSPGGEMNFAPPSDEEF